MLALLAVTLIAASICSASAGAFGSAREDVSPSCHYRNQIFQQSDGKITITAVSNESQGLSERGSSVILRASYLRVPSSPQVAATVQRCVRLAWAKCQDARRRSAERFTNFRVPRVDSETKTRLGKIVAAAGAFGQVLHAGSCSKSASEPQPEKVHCWVSVLSALLCWQPLVSAENLSFVIPSFPNFSRCASSVGAAGLAPAQRRAKTATSGRRRILQPRQQDSHTNARR
jgi:hypothetical protein